MAKLSSLQSRTFVFMLAAAVLSAGLLATGCSEEEKTDKAETENSNLPPAQVDLPEAPPESAFQVQEKNADGTFRIAGLIQYRDKYLNKPVRIKGVIVEMSEDCDPKKAKKEGKECPEPHFLIKDTPDAEKDLMVVGYKQEFVDDADLEAGQEHVFEGTYKKVAQGFVASEEGLLLLDKVGEESVLEEK